MLALGIEPSLVGVHAIHGLSAHPKTTNIQFLNDQIVFLVLLSSFYFSLFYPTFFLSSSSSTTSFSS